MNDRVCDSLEHHFDTAFAAPDGIKKLRELILTLAMQGKLVEQDPSDQPASQLLKEIEAEKKRLVKEGKIKGKSPSVPLFQRGKTTSISGTSVSIVHEASTIPLFEKGGLGGEAAEKQPYALPRGWEWARLGEICEYNGRDNVAPEFIASDAWLLDLEDIEKDTSRLIYRAKYSERQSKSTKSTFQKGDVLYGKLRPYLDKVIVADADGVCTTEIVPIVPYQAINAEFLRLLLKRPAFLSHVNSLMYGVKMPRLGTEDAVQSIHPLPPLPEQHRIVAKINQLMARCDELEKLCDEREQKRRSVHTAALKQLLDAQAGDSFTDAWQFITQHFGELYAVCANVTELRKAILQLAVMGKLVPQDQSDPPVVAPLVSTLAEASVNGVSKGPTTDASATEVLRISAGTSQPDFYVNEGDFKYVDLSNDEIKKFQLAPNDLLACRFNGNLHYVGRFSLYRGISGRIQVNPDKLIRFRVDANAHSPRYVCYMMNAASTRQEIEVMCATTAGNIGLSAGRLKTVSIPLPSLEQQQMIVAKIDQLMALCDTLEQRIAAATGKQAELLNAVMAQV